MKTDKMGTFICTLRKEKDLTQTALAEKLNISNRTISKWENGDGYPDITILPQLAEILDVTVDELLKGEKQPTQTPQVNVTEIENKDNLNNIFEIAFVISLFFGIFGAILGCVTEFYSMWAFSILFYTHWEIIFVFVALFATIASCLVFTVGVTRLRVSYTKEEVWHKTKNKACWLGFILCLFPISFIGRIIDCSYLPFWAKPVTILLYIIIIVAFILLRKKINKKDGQ